MGFLEWMLGNLMRGGFGGHHGGYRGGHHGGSRHGGYGSNPGYPQDSGPAITCLKCGSANGHGARFCRQCGASLAAAQCSGCGAELTAGAKFCGQCGKPPAVTQHLSRCEHLIPEERQHGRKI